MLNRLYLVKNNQTDAITLVEAHHPAAAIKAVASDLFTVTLPTAMEVMDLAQAGHKVIRAKVHDAAA
jgi:hypothetical protein